MRCKWCNETNPLYVEYHDSEWGIPSSDEKYLLEMLILESFQAGLSWECVLNKRHDFEVAYDYFDINKIINYDEDKINIYAEKHILHISSHENEKKEDKDKKYLIRERSVKSFERSFTLPEDAEEEKISASYQKGILSVFIPKKPKEEPKKIAVKIN